MSESALILGVPVWDDAPGEVFGSTKKDGDTSPRLQNEPRTHYYLVVGGKQSYVVARHAHTWQPPPDVLEQIDRVVVLVEIAGMRAGEYNIRDVSTKRTSQRIMETVYCGGICRGCRLR